jgi:hypothetical protein
MDAMEVSHALAQSLDFGLFLRRIVIACEEGVIFAEDSIVVLTEKRKKFLLRHLLQVIA